MDSDDMIKDKFMRLWKFFAWLDKARWSEPDGDFKERTIRLFNKKWNEYGIALRGESLESEDIILAHWLTYIFSYGMRDELVWPKAFPIMGYIAYKFRKDQLSAEQIRSEHIQNTPKENYMFFVKGSDKEPLSFTHRFGKKHKLDKALIETLKMLEGNYERSLLRFMLEKTANSAKDTWIKDVANELHKLTYSPESKKGEMWRKRTWSAFRDYLKGNLHRVYVREAVEKYKGKYQDNVLEMWRNPEPYLDQLELPGDIWNIRFFKRIDEYYLKPLLDENYVKKGEKAPKNVRELYKKLYDEAKREHLYPEQFDVTFDFDRLFCSKSDWKGHCKICPLGGNKITKICIGPLENAEKKYCPVVSLVCDYYFMECKRDDCPVFSNNTRELCPSFQKKV